MRLQNITATPHPAGNRIDLTWRNPAPEQFSGVRVVRRTGRHPVSPDDGVVVVEGLGLASATDSLLRGETVYYYMLFPFAPGTPPLYRTDRHNRTAAMATTPYGHAEQMAHLLPTIYQRYDMLTNPNVAAPADREKGQLRRFLDLPGAQLDTFYSFITALLDAHHLDKLDGHLLPLLAHWIGWPIDYRLEFDAQRNELHHAPALYQTVGLVPTVEATVKRVSNWESRTKEFVYNLFQSNQPERFNLWLQTRAGNGVWSTTTAPLSLDFAYTGRPTMVRMAGDYLLFYHTMRRQRWAIWYKTLHTFTVALDFADELDRGVISNELQQAFATAGFPLSAQLTLTATGGAWQLIDLQTEQQFGLRQTASALQVYHWTPSQPLNADEPNTQTLLQRRPTAARQGERLWLFWELYDTATQLWQVAWRSQEGGNGSPMTILTQPGDDPAAPPLRKQPQAIVDNADPAGVWLFWLEKDANGGSWQVRYNRHDGTTWALDPPARISVGERDDARMAEDLHLFFHTAEQTIWLFWSQRTPLALPQQARWSVLHRVKRSLDPTAEDWEERAVTLPKPDADSHDREPAAHLNAAGEVELFWSSTRTGNWSIWQASWQGDRWGAASQVTMSPYSQRDPLPLVIEDETWLLHHASDSLAHQSQLYAATNTVDARYAGSTTLHVQNREKLAQQGTYGDFQTYTYDAGQTVERDNLAASPPEQMRTNSDWYGRDTIGLYLTPDTADEQQRQRTLARLDPVLREFMPATARAVYILPADA